MTTSTFNQKVFDWLHSVLQPEYHNAQRVFDDVADVLFEFTSIRPKTDVYTYEDGRSRLLLLLHGILPITFRGSSYSVPLHIWVPQEYPRNCPLIFVVPSPGMGVRPGNYVDIDRRCYHPSLAYWTEDVRRSTLIKVIRQLREAFCKEPPLYAINESTRPSQTTTESIARTPSHSNTSPISTNRHAVNSSGPPIPAKQRVIQSTHASVMLKSGYTSTLPQVVHGNSQNPPVPPPVPPHPATSTFPLNRSAAELLAQNTQVPSSETSQPSSKHVGQLFPRISKQERPQKDFLSDDLAQRSSFGAAVQSLGSRVLDLLQHIDTSTCAISQRARLEFESQTNEVEHNLQQAFQIEARLMTESSHLQYVKANCDSNCEILQDRIHKVDTIIGDANRIGSPNVDEILVAQNVVYNQLYDLVAEELALEDTVYTLGKALECEKIDLDTFLKHVRILAREQFMQRLLILKISASLGLESIART